MNQETTLWEKEKPLYVQVMQLQKYAGTIYACTIMHIVDDYACTIYVITRNKQFGGKELSQQTFHCY